MLNPPLVQDDILAASRLKSWAGRDACGPPIRYLAYTTVGSALQAVRRHLYCRARSALRADGPILGNLAADWNTEKP